MSRKAHPQPLARFIYVIGPQQGLQKVGLATDPQSRLTTLQTASPFDLVMHAAVAVPFREAHSVERRAHQLLARSRVRNEWFETSPAEAMAAIHSASAPFKGSATRAPDPSVIWPASSTWRISRAPQGARTPCSTWGDHLGDGLPLFEFSRPAPGETPTFAPETPLEALAGFSARDPVLRWDHHLPVALASVILAARWPDTAVRGNRAIPLRALQKSRAGGGAGRGKRQHQPGGSLEVGHDGDARLMDAIRTALEQAGAVFLDNGTGPGVKLRKAGP